MTRRGQMVRRLALGSPYSKPSTATAEDGLPHTAHSLSFAGQYFASIAAVHISMQCGQARCLCDATIGLCIARLGLRRFWSRLDPLERPNRTQSVSPVI